MTTLCRHVSAICVWSFLGSGVRKETSSGLRYFFGFILLGFGLFYTPLEFCKSVHGLLGCRGVKCVAGECVGNPWPSESCSEGVMMTFTPLRASSAVLLAVCARSDASSASVLPNVPLLGIFGNTMIFFDMLRYINTHARV